MSCCPAANLLGRIGLAHRPHRTDVQHMDVWLPCTDARNTFNYFLDTGEHVFHTFVVETGFDRPQYVSFSRILISNGRQTEADSSGP
jgi:hypothetical protein